MPGYRLIIALIVLGLLTACSARQITEHYSGATEQRLVTHSIHRLLENLPREDFAVLLNQPVFLECFFVNQTAGPLEYARQRLEMALKNQCNCRLVETPAEAAYTLTVFFTSLGTNFDKFGLTTPELILPVTGGISAIDIIALEMYHGISSCNYFITETGGQVIVAGQMKKKVVRNDSLKLPLISIPIKTVP